jgi:fermentation-respiration switch protein FrsA (DUF1100 family)
MKLSRRRKICLSLLVAAGILGVIFVWNIGSVLVLPAHHQVSDPPTGFAFQSVEFPSRSGATIHGWLIPGEPGHGAVVLMHGVHADRRTMLARAQFLSKSGFAVLLFDFQAHGESLGRQITFGFLESRDAQAAVNFVRQKLPGERIGVIGVSLGAASALLAEPPLPVDALVLESSFPTIYQATDDRLVDRFGWIGKIGTPLLTCQLKPRLGIGPEDLRPIEHAKTIYVPKFFIAGSTDPLTTARESEDLFNAAAAPKEFWLVPGAGHVDMHGFAGAEYERRVMAFLMASLHRASS